MGSRLHARIGTLRQLEILLAVHDEGGVTAAAEQLHLTQSTVSMQLKKLSDAIEMPLYQRVGKRQIFTEAGEALVHTARDVMQQFEQLDMQLADMRGLKSGVLRISMVTTSKYFIPHLIGSFCERYPELDVEFHVGNRQQIIDRLHEGLDDLYVFSHPPENEDIAASAFLPNPLVAIAPQGHPLSKRRTIALEQLVQQPLLMRERGSGTRYAIEKHFKEKDVNLQIRMTIESNEAIKHAVMAGLGISILSEHTLAFGGSEGLVELSVKGLPIQSQWYLVRQRQRQPSLVAQAFLDYLEASDQLGEVSGKLSLKIK